MTPSYDAAPHIVEAMTSVLTQRVEDAEIHYHVQDGLSTDGTMALVRDFAEGLDAGTPHRLTRFSWDSGADAGMYDAINRGFEALQPRDDDLLTWINADDLLPPGALATALQVTRDVPGCAFFSGRVALINEHGSLTTIGHPIAYAQQTLAAGLHDGRRMPFIMQEGTFFTGALWNKVGGVDRAFRLAGDWDLWRRMAAITPHHTVDSVIGMHRRHPGQLTHDLAPYHKEVSRLAPDGLAAAVDRPLASTLIRYDGDLKRWVAAPFDPAGLQPSMLIGSQAGGSGLRVEYEDGFFPPEGPYVEFGLPAGVRWMSGIAATMIVTVTLSGRHRFRIRLRAGCPGLTLVLAIDGLPVFASPVPAPRPMGDDLVEFVCWLPLGRRTISLQARASAPRIRRLLVVETEVLTEARSIGRSPAASRPVRDDIAITIDAAGRDAMALAATLETIDLLAQRPRCILAGLDRSALTMVVLRGFADLIDGVSFADDPQADARVAANASYRLFILAGDRVLAGLFDGAAIMAATPDVQSVAGLVDVNDSAGRIVSRDLDGAPHLRRAGAPDDVATIGIGHAMIGRMLGDARADPEANDGPPIWLLERSGDGVDLAPLAAALALLGAVPRHIVLASDATPPAVVLNAPDGEIVITSWPCGRARRAALTACAGRTGIVLRGRTAVLNLPLVVDTTVFAPRPAWIARAQLGLAADALVIVADLASREMERLAAAIGRDRLTRGTIILAAPGDGDRGPVVPIGAVPRILAAWLNAADHVVVGKSGATGALAVAACATGRSLRSLAWVTAILAAGTDPDAADWSGDEQGPALPGSPAPRIEDLAIALRAQADRLPESSGRWLADARTLKAGPVGIATGDEAGAPVSPILEPGHLAGIARLLRRDASLPEQSMIGSGAGMLLETAVPVSVLRILARRHGAGSDWSLAIAGVVQPFTDRDGTDLVEAVCPVSLEPGAYHLEFLADHRDGLLEIVRWEPLGVAGWRDPPQRLATTFRTPLAGCRRERMLLRDGDWCYRSGFLPEEPAHPELGLHHAFRWTRSRSAAVLMRIDHPGRRRCRIVFSTIIEGQRIRLRVDGGSATDWSVPGGGVIGRADAGEWLVDLPAGDIVLTIEMARKLGRAASRPLGIILLAIELGLPIAEQGQEPPG